MIFVGMLSRDWLRLGDVKIGWLSSQHPLQIINITLKNYILEYDIMPVIRINII